MSSRDPRGQGMKRKTGRFERNVAGGESVEAFVPDPLPPSPPLELGARLGERVRLAEQSLGRLELAGAMVPSVDWFLYAFVRKEAVITSQIEGIQATLVDLLRFEAQGAEEPTADVREVCNYVDALRYARAQLASPKGLPLSMRLLSESHRRLMRGVRGASKQPGKIRTSQNWIGGSRPGNAAFVPPPPHRLPDLLSDFEKYLNQDDREASPLVRAGLAHVQFETIHPYLDGNGRIGRLLITLLLEESGALTQPLLYLSLFFKRHRDEYYRRLSAVRSDGDWEGWLDFYLDGVATIAEEGVTSARELFALVTRDRERVLSAGGTSVAAVRLLEALPRQPVVSVGSAMKVLETTKPTAGRAIDSLVTAGVLIETTGRRRDRGFAYQAYLDLLRKGTELGSDG